MVEVSCISVNRDNSGKIVSYTLQDNNNNTKNFKPNRLKQLIKNGEIAVDNIKLTSNNRLLKIKNQHFNKDTIQKMIDRARMLGTLSSVKVCDNTSVYVISSNNNYIVYIPDNVTTLRITSTKTVLTDPEAWGIYKIINAKNIQELTLIGGKGITNTSFLFYDCNIGKLDLSNFDTSNVEIMEGMFYECQIKTLELGKFNTSKVVDMSHMFENCDCMDIDLSNFDVSNVADMRSMFFNCTTTVLNLSNFNTHKVKTMEGMFGRCCASYLDISNINTHNVKSMELMFTYCKINKIVGIEKLDTSNVTNMSYMFANTTFKTLDLSNFNTDHVENMHRMFNSSQIKSLDLSSFTNKRIVRLDRLFYNASIKRLNLKGFCTDTALDLSEMFTFAKIPYIDASGFKLTNPNAKADDMFRSIQCDTLIAPKISKKNYLYKIIGMFSDSKIRKLCLEEFDLTNVISVAYLFCGCNIESIDTRKIVSSGKKDMEAMFREANISVIDLCNFDTKGKVRMCSMFSGCEAKIINLESFELTNSAVTINMFYNCKSHIKVKDKRLLEQLNAERK